MVNTDLMHKNKRIIFDEQGSFNVKKSCNKVNEYNASIYTEFF